MQKMRRIVSVLLAVVMLAGLLGTAMFTSAAAKPYKDVTTEDWFYENVKSLKKMKLMIGYHDGTFRPENNISLAESIAVAARIHAGYTQAPALKQGDVWYEVYTDYAVKNKLVVGLPSDVLAPATRLEFAHLLAKSLPTEGLEAINRVPDGAIPDVKGDEAIYLLYRAGVLIGADDEGNFLPERPITRSEAAAIITRMADPSLRMRSGIFASAEVEVDNSGAVKNETAINADGASATVAAGTATEAGTTKLALSVTYVKDSKANVKLTYPELISAYDVHVEGLAADNTVPVLVELETVLKKGLSRSNVALYHVENGETVAMTQVDSLAELDTHNEFYYDPDTGKLTVAMATFSEIAAVANEGWDGKAFDTSWYNTTATEFVLKDIADFVGFARIVGGMVEGIEMDTFAGKTVKLDADIDLGGLSNVVWYPIGYRNNTGSYNKVSGKVNDTSVTSDVYSFEGTFDGQNHTISNIYQNTWDMFGDYNSGYSGTPNHYKDGMGLFGFVYNGTVKNLTVKNFQSDGEFCTTGVVSAYASGSSTFENITILNSNPRAYNVPNGGVVGYAYAAEGYDNVINFTNVNVDSSNKISALWGSWDVGCGGVLGRVNGATTVNMTNCEVGAEIDVFNDVCGNYQYYQYRYAGMLIGTVGGDSNPLTGAEKVNFSNVNVYIGNWADYYFCEFEKNSQGSYTDDFQFSRVEKNEIVFDDSTNLPKSCTHTHTPNEDKLAVYLPFSQIYTGYGWGSNPQFKADGVTVVKQFYSVTYMDATGTNVLDVEYVTTGERSDSKIWADAYTVKSNSISPAASGQKFNGWRTAASVAKTKIDAGNRDNIVLYESWDNPYTVRFVDQFGNVIHAETFTTSDTSISEPAVPEVEGFTGVWMVNEVLWENYDLSKATSDITVRPVYSYQGNLRLIPIDSDNDGDVDYYQVAGYGDGDDKTVVKIPAYVNGIPVTEINANAFSSYNDLHSVVIPITMENVGEHILPGSWSVLDKGEDVTLYYEGSYEQWVELEKTFNGDWEKGVGKGSRIFFMNGTGKVDPSQGYLQASLKTNWYGKPQSVTWNLSTVTASLKTEYTGECNCSVTGCKGNTRPDAIYWEGVTV